MKDIADRRARPVETGECGRTICEAYEVKTRPSFAKRAAAQRRRVFQRA